MLGSVGWDNDSLWFLGVNDWRIYGTWTIRRSHHRRICLGGSVAGLFQQPHFGFGWDLQKHQPYRFIHSTRNSSCPGTLHGCGWRRSNRNPSGGRCDEKCHLWVNNRHVSLTFVMAGFLFWLTAACLLVPIFWNMNSVLANLTIDFPPDFYLPSAPVKQEVGTGIGIGIGSGVLLILSGLLLMCNRYPKTKCLSVEKQDMLTTIQATKASLE